METTWIIRSLLLCFVFTSGVHSAAVRRRVVDNDDPHLHPRPQGIQTAALTLEDGVDWMARGKQDLADTLAKTPTVKPARNLVIVIGDGMGVSTLTAARFFKAQRGGDHVADTDLAWERFPATGLIKTYNTDQQTADSAGTATAFLSGEKTRAGVVGLNQRVLRGDCNSTVGNELTTLFDYAMQEGKWTGLVTTTRVTHATPSSAYAHSPERDWEDDSEIPPEVDQGTCWDIAKQLIYGDSNRHIRVILGGGRRNFMPNATPDPQYPDRFGRRLDGLDLRQEWVNIHENMFLEDGKYTYVENKTAFDNVDALKVDYLMGLFGPSHLKFETERVAEPNELLLEPSLKEMVQKALDILKRGPNGYVLLVEAGRIDHGHHFNQAHNALQDTMALDTAVAHVVASTSDQDTLLVVSADHSHTFSIAGYPHIDNDILGVVIDPTGEMTLADDGKPYTTLGYVNGQGYYMHRTVDDTLNTETVRMNLTGIQTNGTDFEQDAGVPMEEWETHAGEDVAVYARGPMSHLFVGLHEQSYIAHAVTYAACLGWNKDLCATTEQPTTPLTNGAVMIAGGSRLLLNFFVFWVVLCLGIL